MKLVETEESDIEMSELVWSAYRERHCDQNGVPIFPLNFKTFSRRLLAEHPDSKKALPVALKK